LKGLPEPQKIPRPPGLKSKSGTLVILKKCDRLDYRKLSTVENKLAEGLGRLFRYKIYGGVQITVNHKLLSPIDPLFLNRGSNLVGADPFGHPLNFEILSGGALSTVEVKFVELP